MSEFEREDRYAVIKYKKLTPAQWTLVPSLLEKFDSARVDCVVVEKDWPEYNFVWLMLEHRMAGYPAPDFNAVKCAADVAIAQAELETANATIARLTAENERTERNRDMWKAQVERQAGALEQANTEAKEWKDTVKFNEGCWSEERGTMIDNLQAARAEIERLKGGQGEPVMKLEAERLWEGDGEYSVSFVKSGWLDQCRKTGGTFFLYTSPPAPVSVVLPERMQWDGLRATACNIRGEGWNACLDKVKELNR
jgi:hypothetical protein